MKIEALISAVSPSVHINEANPISSAALQTNLEIDMHAECSRKKFSKSYIRNLMTLERTTSAKKKG
jgi:hypothetical protein